MKYFKQKSDTLPEWMRSIVEAFSHVVWPQNCPICGRLSSPGCLTCLCSLLVSPRRVCLVCGSPCDCACHQKGPIHQAGCLHTGLGRDLVLLLKYKNHKALGRRMGEAMAQVLKQGDGELLVPVPLHQGSPRLYNQALLLAEGLSKVWKVPIANGLVWRVFLEPQTAAKSSASRRSLPPEAILWKGSSLAKKRVLLVDDVFTTGSTLRTAALAISRAGGSVEGSISWSLAPERCDV